MARFRRYSFLLCVAFFLGLAAVLIIGTGPAQAAPAWTEWGPPGGDVRRIDVSASAAAPMLALTAGPPGEMYGSADSGKSWSRLALLNDTLIDFARDARNPSLIFVLGEKGLSKSSDAGSKFSAVATIQGLSCKNGGRLAISPADGSVFLAATLRLGAANECLVILKSKDGGTTWTTAKFDESAKTASVRALVISERNPKVLYFSGFVQPDGESYHRNRVLRSLNGGASWTPVVVPLLADTSKFYTRPSAVAVDPRDHKRVFIAHEKGVVRTADGGATWFSQQTPKEFHAGSIAVDPADGRAIYAPSANIKDDRGCYRSADGGATWKKSNKGVYGAGRCAIVDGGSVFIGSSAGLFKSANGGRLFKPAQAGIQASRITVLTATPSAPSTIYAGVGNYSLFSQATVPGAAWVQSRDFYRCEGVLSVAVFPSDPEKLYLLAGG